MKWECTTLGNLTGGDSGLVQTGPFGSQLHQHEYTDEGVPVVMPKDIFEGGISLDGIARVPEGVANRLSRHKLKPNSIVLPRRGEVTKRAFVSEEQEGWICGTGCLKIEVPDDLVYPRFMYYLMGTTESVRWLINNAVGTTMLNLSAKIVNEFPVALPPLPIQTRIADILSAYDDLIENNKRRMQLLEEAARQLYREWFVRLRFPGHEHTKITNGLHEGWERSTASEAISVNPRTKLDDNETHPWVEMADLPTDSMVVSQFSHREGRTGSKFKNGDTLLARITPCLENGKTGYVNFLAEGEAGRGSTEFIVLRPHKLTSEMTYLLARTYDFRENAIKSMVGSSGRQRVQESCFEKFFLVIPPASLQAAFTETVRPMFNQIRNSPCKTKSSVPPGTCFCPN